MVIKLINGRIQGLIYKIIAVSDISQKRHFFLKKRAPKISPPPVRSDLHQSKALHNFYKREQRPTAGRI